MKCVENIYLFIIFCKLGPKKHVHFFRASVRDEARVSAVGVLKGVLSLQIIFSMVGEPIVERTHRSEY